MQRFKKSGMDMHPDGEWVRWEDVQETLKRQASAAHAAIAAAKGAAVEYWKIGKQALPALTEPFGWVSPKQGNYFTRNKSIADRIGGLMPVYAAPQPSHEPKEAEVPEGWKLVPVEPTREMWAAFNKLDDEMAAGSYDGTGCSFEQGWNCMLAAAPQPPQESKEPR